MLLTLLSQVATPTPLPPEILTLVQAGPVPIDWQPLVIPVATLIGAVAVIIGIFGKSFKNNVNRQEAASARQEATFVATIASNEDLHKRLDASNERNIKLAESNTKFQDDIIAQGKKIEILNDKLERRDAAMTTLQDKNNRLDKEILELDKGQFELNKKFTELGGAYAVIEAERDALKTENTRLADKITELETALIAVDARNDGLEKMILELRTDIDKLREDKAARVQMSAHGADNATVERLLSDAKSQMIQVQDEPPKDAA